MKPISYLLFVVSLVAFSGVSQSADTCTSELYLCEFACDYVPGVNLVALPAVAEKDEDGNVPDYARYYYDNNLVRFLKLTGCYNDKSEASALKNTCRTRYQGRYGATSLWCGRRFE